MIRAATVEELELLVAMCRAGMLFEIQEWIRQGKPVALPEGAGSRAAKRNPLQIAMERGFHSLVQVLLEAGAPHHDWGYNALDHAVGLRRPDLAALVLKHGAKVGDVSMRFVMDMWQPEMVDLFITNGADLESDNPIAWALIHKMRPALGLLKRFSADRPGLMRQADFALRFHANEGSARWVSLLLWAGADPWTRGPEQLEELDEPPCEDSDYLCAVELAVRAGKLDQVTLKKLVRAPNPDRPETMRLLEQACHSSNSQVLALLLEKGYRPGVLPDLGTGAINSLMNLMTWELPDLNSLYYQRRRSGIDSSRARECMKMLHMLVEHGARWLPEGMRVIGDVRRSLLAMAPGYQLEFTWLMSTYGAARRRDVQELLRTPAMARLLGKERERANQLLAGIPEDPLLSGAEDGQSPGTAGQR